LKKWPKQDKTYPLLAILYEGSETKDILNDKGIGRRMESIRSHAGVVYGVAKDEHSVDVEWPVTPFSAIVMPPCDYLTMQGEKIGVGIYTVSLRP
jgi:2-methylaconitate cis-trans-isomerase PrpF